MQWVLPVLALSLVVPVAVPQGGASPIPGPDDLDHWLRFIRPTPEELAYEKIGWRNQLAPAIEEARRLGRPILLWTMNGHPLGCT